HNQHREHGCQGLLRNTHGERRGRGRPLCPGWSSNARGYRIHGRVAHAPIIRAKRTEGGERMPLFGSHVQKLKEKHDIDGLAAELKNARLRQKPGLNLVRSALLQEITRPDSQLLVTWLGCCTLVELGDTSDEVCALLVQAAEANLNWLSSAEEGRSLLGSEVE